MPKKRLAFFDAKAYDERFFNAANASRQEPYEFVYFATRLNSKTVNLVKGFDGICAFVNDIMDAEVIESLYNQGVKVIALRCAGYNNVDFKTALNKIHVLRVPAYSPHAVAEHAIALIMTLNRKTHKAYYRTRDANFAIRGLLGFDMNDKTAGVIGTGKIGKCLTRILRGFGMQVLLSDPFPDQAFAEEAGARYVDLEEVYQKSDIISLHCPLTPKTEYMINAESIDLMKNNVLLINTGRGKLINTAALIEGLKENKVGGAGLDVYEEEAEYFFEDYSTELIKDDVLARLLTFPNVLVTSHQAFFTQEALQNIAETTLSNLDAFFENRFLENEICYRCQRAKCAKKEGKPCF